MLSSSTMIPVKTSFINVSSHDYNTVHDTDVSDQGGMYFMLHVSMPCLSLDVVYKTYAQSLAASRASGQDCYSCWRSVIPKKMTFQTDTCRYKQTDRGTNEVVQN